MNKRLLLAAVLMGTIFTAEAQTTQTLFSDGFETYNDFIINNIGNWTQIDVDGAPTYNIEVTDEETDESIVVDFENTGYTGTAIVFNSKQTDPQLIGYEARTGDKSLNFIAAVSDNDVDPELVGPNNDWIITPKIKLGSNGNNVTFWAKSLTNAYGLERLNVLVSTTSNTDRTAFTRVSTPTGTRNYTEVPTEWTQYTINLDAYNAKEVYIALNYVSDDAFVMMVDDFAVTTTGTLNIDEALSSQFTVSPNPANSIINISNANNMLLNSVSISDVNGRTIKTLKFDGVATAQVNVSDLASGVYMLNISSDKGNITKKIVRN